MAIVASYVQYRKGEYRESQLKNHRENQHNIYLSVFYLKYEKRIKRKIKHKKKIEAICNQASGMYLFEPIFEE